MLSRVALLALLFDSAESLGAATDDGATIGGTNAAGCGTLDVDVAVVGTNNACCCA